MSKKILGTVGSLTGFVQRIMPVAATAILMLGAGVSVSADPLVKSGEKIAFLGHSVTQNGTHPGGYITLTVLGLKAIGIETTAINAGMGGSTAKDMLDKIDCNVIDKKPDWMVFSCGGNDMWSQTTLETFKENATKIVEKAQAANIKVVILTEQSIYKDAEKLIPYNEFLLSLAKEKKCLSSDIYVPFQGAMKNCPWTPLTTDGFHPNAQGSLFMAKGVLKAFGLNDEQMAKAEKAILDQPDTFEEGDPSLQMRFTLRQIKFIDDIAAKNKLTTDQMISLLLAADLFTDAPINKRADISSFLDTQRGKDTWKEMQDRLNRRLNILMTGKE